MDNSTQFKKGNQLWRMNQNIGRKPLFKTPEELWEKAIQYFQYIDDNPILKTDFKGKENEIVKYDLQRPYTWQGFYVFLGVKDLEHYKTKAVFSEILTHIGNIIYSQKYEGASVGIFNHAIIARDLGLTERIDHTTKGKEMGAYKDWTDEQIEAEIERLKNKD
jgi:hypothetical protein